MSAIHKVLVSIVLLPVMFYRRVLSPMKRAPTCKYLPTCSEYAIDAVKSRGIIVGIGLAIWRILRCNPFARGGFDPVPESKPLLSGPPQAGPHSCGEHH